LILALVAVSLGLITLVGWAARIDQLAAILPGELPMKANAAVLLVLLGVGVILMAEDHRHRLARGLAVAASESRLRTAMDAMVDGVVVSSAIRDEAGRIVDFRFVYANANIGTISGIPADSQIIEHTLLEMFPAHRTNGLFEAYVGVVETGVAFESLDRDLSVAPLSAGGPLDKYVDQHVAKLGDGYVLSVRDVTTRHRAEAEMRRLSTAIEQSADGILIADAEGRIEYVNPAFERVSGYAREEVIGQNPRILKSGVQEPAFYEAMWATLTNGRSFVGDLTNRRKDGSLFQEQAVISPIVDVGGKVTSYVAVNHDMTRERELEAASMRLARERTQITDSLAGLQASPSPEATAEAICRKVVRLAGVASAGLYLFSLEGPIMPLAFVLVDGKAVLLRPLPARRSEYLRERAEGGPWVEAWVHRPWHPYERLFREMGVRAVSYAPVRHGGDLVGLLTITSSDEDAISRSTEFLPALLEFAAVAGVLVGPAVVGLTEAGNVRRRITGIIRDAQFHPVFQPIVDLESRETVGFEALTRFDSGQRPDLCFADARAVDLGLELELATLRAAMAAARALPAGRWLSLNISPRLLLDTERVNAVLWPSERPIFLEITEHEIIDDYGAVSAAIRALGHDVRLAVDDAGAGIANFSHIVELRPNLVKLDMGLVRDVNSDLGRQALVVGLRHFARQAGCRLLAEGIETEQEAGTMGQLAVELGQGYLFGRPEPAETWATPAAKTA
jgi:PAS domain S-box-containing protein